MAANEAICKDMLDADLTAAILRLIDGAGVLRRSIGNGRLVTCEEPGTDNAGRVPGSSGRVILRTHQPSDPDPDQNETDGTLLRGWLSGLPAAAFWERRRYLAGPRLSSLLLIDESFPQNS